MKFSRVSNFIDKYGILKGIGLYLDIKFGRLSKITVPGIKAPIFLRKDTTDVAMFDQVFLHDDYKIDFSFEPKVIVDAGANVGLFSILMKNRFPEAKIICIEPNKENCEVLKKNLSPYHNVEIVNAGVWNSITKLNIFDKYNAGFSALVVEEDAVDGGVDAITIDSLMQTYGLERIDILKIDIETSEKELFLENYEQWLPKIRMIIIELHDWLKPGCSRVFFEAINKTIKNYSYSVSNENTIVENKDLN
ncbi:MAG: FkbM family methyltransferase [Chitinophagaceae bacterium]